MTMKILLPVDGSANSDRAVAHVIELIRKWGPMIVHVLHVQAPVLYIELLANPSPEAMDRWTQKVGREMSRSACALLDQAGVAYTLDILEGETGETIARQAREGAFDWIVMGTRGRSGVANLFIGSVSMKVVQLADIPVTLVK